MMMPKHNGSCLLILINVIRDAAVWMAIDQCREKGLNDQTEIYNTHGHKRKDICTIVPERNGYQHVGPDRTDSHFSKWLDVIVVSWGIHQVRVSHLPSLLTAPWSRVPTEVRGDNMRNCKTACRQEAVSPLMQERYSEPHDHMTSF